MLDLKVELMEVYNALNSINEDRKNLTLKLRDVSLSIFDLKIELDKKEEEIVGENLDENYSLPQKNAEAREAFRKKILSDDEKYTNTLASLNEANSRKVKIEHDLKILSDEFSILKEKVRIFELLAKG